MDLRWTLNLLEPERLCEYGARAGSGQILRKRRNAINFPWTMVLSASLLRASALIIRALLVLLALLSLTETSRMAILIPSTRCS